MKYSFSTWVSNYIPNAISFSKTIPICMHLNSYLITWVLPYYSFKNKIVCFLITGDLFMKKWPGVNISMINNIFHGSESYTAGNLFFPAYT